MENFLKHSKNEIAEITTKSSEEKETRIVIWNINGMRAFIKKSNLKELNESRKIDILCFYELKLDIDAYKTMKIEQELKFLKMKYKYFNFSQKKGYAGVSVFSRIKPISVIKKFHSDHDQESRLLVLEFEKFYLVSVYVPCSGENIKRLDYRMKWDEDIKKYLLNLKSKKNLIYIGDLNVVHQNMDIHNPLTHIRSPSCTVEEKRNFSDLLSNGFYDAFRKLHPKLIKYSYWNYRFNSRMRNKGWRVDYFLIDHAFWKFVKTCNILDKIKGSDHCPLEIVFSDDIWTEEELSCKYNDELNQESLQELMEDEIEFHLSEIEKEISKNNFKKEKKTKLNLVQKDYIKVQDILEANISQKIIIKVEYGDNDGFVITGNTKLQKEYFESIIRKLI